jgi:uncharacterized protein YecT (DUF1311 family)
MLSRLALIAVLAAVAACLGVAGAAAQNRKPTAQEIKAVRDCAEKYRDDLGEGENHCFFSLVAEPCSKAEGGSNLGTADCYRIETVVWDGLLNDNYKELMDSLDDKEQEKKLKEMQRAWIANRDNTCDFYWYKIRGSMSVPMTAACQLRETGRRAMLLKFLVQL